MAMREKSKRGFPIGSVADLLEGMFLGEQALSGSAADLLEGMFLGEQALSGSVADLLEGMFLG